MGLALVGCKECLHGTLEEVYLEIPPGFETHSGRNKLGFLTKTFTDLKQSPIAWFGRFKNQGFS